MDNHLLPVISFYQQIMSKGEGSFVYDQEGKKYLDLNAGQFCSVFGNNHPELISHLKENMDKLLHTNTELLTDEVLKAADNLNRISGDMDGYSIMLSTGAESVEFCLRFAKHIKKRNGIVCFNKGYHGLTLGAQSVTFGGLYATLEAAEIYSVEIPEVEKNNFENKNNEEKNVEKKRLEKKSLEKLEQILDKFGSKIAAVLMEPLASVGGMIIPSAKYFQVVRKLCDKYDVLLIFDECQTGFGRTGSWFYFQQIDCIPDMLACAKAIGLGFPVSIAMFRKELAECGYKMTHYSSHQNDGFAAMLINFGIEYIEKNGLLDQIKEKGSFFLNELKKLQDRSGKVRGARGRGLMLGLDLCISSDEDSRMYYRRLSERAMEEGLIIQGTSAGQVLRFLPNYLITEEEAKEATVILEIVLMEK